MGSVTESVEVQNVVGSTNIGHELDLQELALDLRGASYDPDQFPGLVYRSQDPKAATLIFRSGKMVCTGGKSIGDVNKAVSDVIDKLENLGIEVVDEPEVTIQNIVSSADTGQQLNLNAIAIGLGLEHIEYEPEQFPGLVYRIDDIGVVTLLFGSGKVVITGASDEEDATEAMLHLKEKLSELGLFSS